VNPRARAVIVVFDDTVTDTEAAMIRNGMNMFTGVRQVIPVRGVPTDIQAAKTIAQQELTKALNRAEQQRDELALRVKSAQEAITGPVPMHDGQPELEWRRSS
jgi:hypothetical protein